MLDPRPPQQCEYAVWKRRGKQHGTGEGLCAFDGIQSWAEAAELCKIWVNGMNWVLSSSEPPRTNTMQMWLLTCWQGMAEWWVAVGLWGLGSNLNQNTLALDRAHCSVSAHSRDRGLQVLPFLSLLLLCHHLLWGDLQETPFLPPFPTLPWPCSRHHTTAWVWGFSFSLASHIQSQGNNQAGSSRRKDGFFPLTPLSGIPGSVGSGQDVSASPGLHYSARLCSALLRGVSRSGSEDEV